MLRISIKFYCSHGYFLRRFSVGDQGLQQKSSVADPACLFKDPGFDFFHPGSSFNKMPDPLQRS
jgi:hypothetical protein